MTKLLAILAIVGFTGSAYADSHGHATKPTTTTTTTPAAGETPAPTTAKGMKDDKATTECKAKFHTAPEIDKCVAEAKKKTTM